MGMARCSVRPQRWQTRSSMPSSSREGSFATYQSLQSWPRAGAVKSRVWLSFLWQTYRVSPSSVQVGAFTTWGGPQLWPRAGTTSSYWWLLFRRHT